MYDNDKRRELGRQWAEKSFLTPGRPEPLKYGDVLHDKACAERWCELTGRYPSWWTYLVKRDDGWWIINAEGAACDCGPYPDERSAESDAKGMANFMKYQNKPGYITSEKKKRSKPTSEAAKKGQKSLKERGLQRKRRNKP
jgi:hypothetical protein